MNFLQKYCLSTSLFTRFILCVLGVLTCIAQSQAAGLMTPNNSNEALDLLEHHVEVVIENGYAITSIEQVFYNKHTQNLEAIYSFPVPKKAAVGEFTYWLNNTPITAEVVAKKQARDIYEKEKQAGRNAALVEQDDYRTFDISVANIQAQQKVRTKLTYIQAVHIDTSVGRYVYPLENGGVDEQSLQFWTQNDTVEAAFSFTLNFRSAYPVEQFRLPQHPNATIEQLSAQEWRVSIANQGAKAQTAQEQNDAFNAQSTEQSTTSSVNQYAHKLDTDILVYWRYPQSHPAHVDLVTYKAEGANKGTYMLTITPGDDLKPIVEGRDWIFVLDYSGSMQGKYQSMVEGVKQGLGKLNPEDRFRVVIFDSSAKETTPSFVHATAQNVAQQMRILEQRQVGSSTNLYEGMEKAIRMIDADRTTALLLVTDGVTNTGKTEKRQFLDLIKGADVRLFTFVMGNSANTPLLNGMTQASNGFAISISNSDDIVGKIIEATSKLNHAAMHDVDIKISGIKVSDQTPSKIGSVYRGQQLIVFGHFWDNNGDKGNQVSVELSAKIAGENIRYKTEFEFDQALRQNASNPELERLWAFAKIEELENSLRYFGQDSDTEQAITDLAIEYGLVTNYTSMLILEEQLFEAYGIEQSNKKRVSNEQAAREQRKLAGVQNNRVDQQQPMYNGPASNHSGGGGSLTPFMLLFIIMLGWARLTKPKC
ncbi:VIT and VWA domain-containing protein [Glaciecola sp. SC05]|uniref:VIT and vWA domain-containing protein n=1 Tax=Glaciecola sp. SC05 TaxID=1987355 RepID=UPI003528FA11